MVSATSYVQSDGHGHHGHHGHQDHQNYHPYYAYERQSSGYDAPAPEPSYGAPAPAPAPSYGAPAPEPSYDAPAPSYDTPSTGYDSPSTGNSAIISDFSYRLGNLRDFGELSVTRVWRSLYLFFTQTIFC